MHPTEIWWLVDAKRPRKVFGKLGLTEDEAAEIMADMAELERL